MTPPLTLLLDRDGVLNRDRHDYVRTLDQLAILPGIPEAVAALNRAGVRLLVVTNQGCIAKGLLDEAGLARIHHHIGQILATAGGHIDAFYHCPHHNGDGCTCRKPAPGMILQAQREWGFDPARTWMVGDTERDMLAARAAGCRGALVLSGHGDLALANALAVPVFQDLADFTRAYLQPTHPTFGEVRHVS